MDAIEQLPQIHISKHDTEPEVCELLLRNEEWWGVGRNFDKSADKVVDIQVTTQLSSAKR